ncbi:MAG: hypothetical protein JXI33_03810 [Candidatus Aminicenantes bacterium]|nr:hypothetical protein [Candidatus Aminicenantes bacterium]
MKKWMVVFAMASLVFCCGQADAAEETAQEQVPVAQAAAKYFDEALASIAGGDVGKGVNLLLEIILLSGPEESFPEGFKAKIEQTRADIGSGDYAAGGTGIRDALRIWDPAAEAEAKAAVKRESENQTPLGQIFKDKLTASRDLFVQGDRKAAVKGILQALLLLSPAPGN